MPPLTSTRNPRVKDLAGLARRRLRDRTGRHLAEGPHAVGIALVTGLVEELLVTSQAPAHLLEARDVAVTEVSDRVLRHVCDAVTPQGVAAVVRTPKATFADVRSELLVVLDGVTDPGNVGGIVRTAQAMGFGAVLATTGSADVFGPKAVRASAGAVYRMCVVGGVELGEILEFCAAHGRTTIGLDMHGHTSVAESAVTGPVALVVGGEAHGLSQPDRLDVLARIPMPGDAESLNAAVAAGIALYELARRVD